MFQLLGTVARDKKTLNALVEKVILEIESKNEKKKIEEKELPQSQSIKKNRILKCKEMKDEEISKYQEKEHCNLNEKCLKCKECINNEKIISEIIMKCEEVANQVTTYTNTKYTNRDRKIDKILTSKKYGIPLMLLLLAIIFWLTIVGANYPSEILSKIFYFIEEKLLVIFTKFQAPQWLIGVVIYGMYRTLSWVVSVMLPPMAIFFPLFTILEDSGYLARIVFNVDNFFRKACTTGKQALTMCMGFGCNAAGVIGCRIIDSKREKLIAILTNVFVPCNGRFPFLITISTIFFGGLFTGVFSSFISTLAVLFVIALGIVLTLIISKILSKTILKGMPSSFILEIPPYRKPEIKKVIIRSIFDRTLFVLGRAVAIAIPTGLVIWIFANINIAGMSILTYIANFLNPFAKLLGLDGYILTAFILGLPANEIVLPIILMSYTAGKNLVPIEDLESIKQILVTNGWTIVTAINVMIFTLLHFPCSTTLITIKKETGSLKWTAFAFLLPTMVGIIICAATNLIFGL